MAKAGATPARSEASTGGRAEATSGGGNPISGEWAYSEAGVGVGIWSAALMAGTGIGTMGSEGLGTLVGLGSASAGSAGGRGLGNALAGMLGAGPGDVSVSMPSSVAKGSGRPTGGAGAKGQRGAPGGAVVQRAEYSPSSTVEVYVGYTKIPNPIACNAVYCSYHAFVTLRDPGTGRNLATRAGPGGKGAPGKWGSIRAQSFPWESKDFADVPEDTVHLQYVGDALMNLAEAQVAIKQLAQRVHAAAIPYDPLGTNSNTYAQEVLRELGMGLVEPDLLTPGWFSRLFPNQVPRPPQLPALYPGQGTPLQI